ncbi:bifunctional demethylmenaquinone methyltransferase/2-methoxy-6-polyprenyl-1,4-benzoquinol methylase UbiE [Altericista sp. CCNU0014]|uniref:bifunctional demethylmenaquinone methyltransferase/2-methoxy-6-polyprenyl-1,4-benzoquinol methylase UbiE n=1 Tax=Altericista sp. CCNU0014 TaxID=3082949 RepID=UPI003850B906
MSSSSSAHVQALFNRIAPVYDRLNGWLSLGQHRVWKQMAIRWANPSPDGINVDLCCGSGDLTLMMARTLRGRGQIVGIDFSERQLAIARARAAFLPWSDALQWIESDILTLPLPDRSVDAITMGYGLRNVTDIPTALSEMYRVLKPGARAAILDFNRPTSDAMQQFQRWYLRQVVVPVAGFFALTEEYAYLEASIARFPTGPEQIQLAAEAGFENAKHYAIAADTMGILVVAKPSTAREST